MSRKGVGDAKCCKCGKKWDSSEKGWKYIKELGLLCPNCAESVGFDSKKPGLMMRDPECQTNSPDIVSIAISATERSTEECADIAVAQPQPDSFRRLEGSRQMSLIQLLNTD